MDLKVKINKIAKDTIEVEIEGMRHTIPNMLRQELWNDSSVSLAAYEKTHPYLGNPKLIIKGKNPKESLVEAIKRVESEFKKFEKEFSKAAK